MPTACARRSFRSAASNADDLLARLGGVLPPSQDAMSNWRPCDAPGMANPMTRQLHLGLNTGRPRETTSCRALRRVFQQRGLSVPRLAAQDRYRAVPEGRASGGRSSSAHSVRRPRSMAPSGGRSRLHPALKGGNLLVRPGAVAGHRAVPQAPQDRVTVAGDVVMRPEVEGEPHRPAVALTKERLDVLREADRVVCGQNSPPVDAFQGDYGSRALVTSLSLLNRPCRSRRGRGSYLARATSIQQTLSSTRGRCPRVRRVVRAGDTGGRCANVVARLLASPTHFCADATVFVMGSVPFALLGTGEARRGAGLNDCADHR